VKKALTLIELIFTVVIIGFVFTVIPKIIQVSNKTLEFSKKEDAIFNMISKMMHISLKKYDENNTISDYILLTHNNGVLDCNETTHYRVGGFKSDNSRMCQSLFSSEIGMDADDLSRDDIDDYNGTSEEVVNYLNVDKNYTLSVNVSYVKEWDKSDYTDGNLTFRFGSEDVNESNIKRIEIIIRDNKGEIISSIKYYSANIGGVKIDKK
jgi:competence protein ComGC